ncbi:helix-turn-helix domain-containing protein [Maricaulis parjimensis]|uniref:helix-turn-helix domain-containing protein n=1 Tax=Maricaulis parjimensis TaxID=144023 RepID=UPI001939E2D5|nr:helix-turn-helix transcriptional regulator [Maricaulis parjimensis]
MDIRDAVIAFGQDLKAFRTEKGLKPEDLAEAAGIPRSALLRLEGGRGGTVDNLVAVLSALGLGDKFSAILAPAEDEAPSKPARRKLMGGPATHGGRYGKSGEWKMGD